MKITIYNKKMLDVALSEIYNFFECNKEINISWEKNYSPKSKPQINFFFGALVESVQDFYRERGEKWEKDEIKENFYSACACLDDNLKKMVTRFNGEKYEVPKRLSEMDRETTSIFIDRCIYLIDHAKCFEGLYLHPSIRYTWVRHITDDDIRQIQGVKLPRLDKDYLEYQRKQACMICGVQNKTEAHHLKEAGDSGTGYRCDDWETMPLCFNCHRLYHQQGKSYLENNIKYITKYIDLADFCKMNYLRWKNHV